MPGMCDPLTLVTNEEQRLQGTVPTQHITPEHDSKQPVQLQSMFL